MGATLYIVVEGEDPGFDIFVNGRALARNEDALEKMAHRIGVKPLLEFFSALSSSKSVEKRNTEFLMELFLKTRNCWMAIRAGGSLHLSRSQVRLTPINVNQPQINTNKHKYF